MIPSGRPDPPEGSQGTLAFPGRVSRHPRGTVGMAATTATSGSATAPAPPAPSTGERGGVYIRLDQVVMRGYWNQIPDDDRRTIVELAGSRTGDIGEMDCRREPCRRSSNRLESTMIARQVGLNVPTQQRSRDAFCRAPADRQGSESSGQYLAPRRRGGGTSMATSPGSGCLREHHR